MASTVGEGAIIYPTNSKTLVHEYVANLLGKVPRDDIFSDSYTRVISLDTVISMSGENEFKLTSLADGYYDLSRLVLEVRVKLVDDDGNVPDKGAQVAPECNILHGLISDLSVLINDKKLNQRSEHYPYKAYLHNMLRFDTESKQALLGAEGWYQDDAGYFDSTSEDNNSGFKSRREKFAKSRDDMGNIEFDKREVVLVGKLITDFMFLKEPLVPNTKVSVIIRWNNNAAFYMHQAASVAKKYHLAITEALLHVTIFTPSVDLRRTLGPRLKTEPIYYHYIQNVVVTEPIMNVTQHTSQNLIKSGATPTRVYIVYIRTESFRGHYQRSPYDFRRLFEPSGQVRLGEEEMEDEDEDETDVSDSEMQDTPEIAEALNALVARTQEMQGSGLNSRNIFKLVQQGVTSIKQRFRKGSNRASAAPSEASTSAAVSNQHSGPATGTRRKGQRLSQLPPSAPLLMPSESLSSLPSYSAAQFSQDHRQLRRGDNPAPTGTRPTPDPLGSFDYHYIQKCTLIADGREIMDIGGKGNTKYDATMDFVRFLTVTGQYGNQNSTASVDLELFNKNCYVCCFDLSTSGRSSLAVSTVANCSLLRSSTEFSKAVPYQLTQLMLLNYNACFSIDGEHRVQTSYFKSDN